MLCWWTLNARVREPELLCWGHLVQARWTTQGSDSYCSLMNSRPAYVELTTRCKPGRGVSTRWHYKLTRLAGSESVYLLRANNPTHTADSRSRTLSCVCAKSHSQLVFPIYVQMEQHRLELFSLQLSQGAGGEVTGPLVGQWSPLAFAFSFGYKVGVGKGKSACLPRHGTEMGFSVYKNPT